MADAYDVTSDGVYHFNINGKTFSAYVDNTHRGGG
jgi:hypothetical protein